MAQQTAQVVIIGAGIVGSSVAYHLAARGCTDVVILERAETEVTGSTARSAAGVRHQFEAEVNIRLSLYSIERLKHFTEEIGGHAELRQVGYLLLVKDPVTWEKYQQEVALQRRLGARTQLLTPAEIVDYVPGTHVDDLLGATFGPDDGYCDPHGIATGYLTRARAMGVQLRRSTPVVGMQLSGDKVIAVQTPTDTISCEFVVNAAGAWAGQVAALANLDVPVQPFRRNAYFTEPFAGFPKGIPMTIDVDSGYWMRSEQQGNLLFGLANPDEPSSENLEVDWDWFESVMDAGLSRFPILEQAQLSRKRSWAGLYEITPDDMPILGRHPELPNYVDASGFSGHGVMHSPATGLLMAEEILDGRAHSIIIDDLRITRFQERVSKNETNIY